MRPCGGGGGGFEGVIIAGGLFFEQLLFGKEMALSLTVQGVIISS